LKSPIRRKFLINNGRTLTGTFNYLVEVPDPPKVPDKQRGFYPCLAKYAL